MGQTPDILCIGSVLWDIIGRTDLALAAGNDKPGRIARLPGGVALNIAMAIRRFGMTPALISAVGNDPAGHALIAACVAGGLDCSHLLIDPSLPTDHYMAIEAQGALIAAVADAHSLEAAGARILAPLADGRLGGALQPWPGLVALDGNLTEALLAEIAQSPLFAAADLRIAPASPGKAERLRALLRHPRATFYVNLEEAGILTETHPATAMEAARAMRAAGAGRVLVTAGADLVVDMGPMGDWTAQPPPIAARRITGAGDTFMAAHIAAEHAGRTPKQALETAVTAAAFYVSGEEL